MSGTPPDPRHRARRLGVLRALALFAVVLGWLALAGVGGPAIGGLSEVQENDAAAFLPADAESTRAAELGREISGEQDLPAFVVAESTDGPLSEDQTDALTVLAEELPAAPLSDGSTVADFLSTPTVPVVPAEDGDAVLLPLSIDQAASERTLDDDEPALRAVVSALRGAVDDADLTGVDVFVTGPAGLAADLTEAFGAIDSLLLLVALGVVLVILLIVYRAVVLPFAVLITSVAALAAAGLVVFTLADAGALTLNGQSQGILFILVVGAATDYGLLLTARYREELQVHACPRTAMAKAWRASVEPIAASAGTVVAGLLCLLLSELNSNRSLGPVAAIGIVAALLAALTLLPALLLAGRWIFWPRIPRVRTPGPDTTDPAGQEAAGPVAVAAAAERHPVWARVARLVRRRPRTVWITTAVLLGLGAAFVPTFSAQGTGQTDVFLTEVDSVTGQEALARHFPGGSGVPVVVLAGQADLSTVLETAQGTEGVESASAVPEEQGTPGAPPDPDATPRVVDGIVEVQATLADEADSEAAVATVRTLRAELADAGVTGALVGGETATQLDTRDAATRDRTLIIPVVLLVVLLVLMALLRSVLAPVLLMLANVLSFGAALGVSALVFNGLLDFPGADPVVPLFAFVFLVALGIDYSIFLMTRVREESIRHGTRDGVLIGLTVTGGVITSAGVVLAATFAALGIVPLLFLAQIAFIVALGVLIDTLVVRSLLVPALAYDVGGAIWWPSRLRARG